MTEIEKYLGRLGLDCDNDRWYERVMNTTGDDVRRELGRSGGRFSLERLAVLISPAAAEHLEEMARQARELTIQRFGKTVQLYAPLYVSNYCINRCKYCGYNASNKFERTRLSVDEALAEADILARDGFRHILLVSGEDAGFVTTDYLCRLAEGLRRKFSSVTIEIYPLSREQYAEVYEAGIDGVTLYQETYHREVYADYHPSGPKSDYSYRLEGPVRFGDAGMRSIGLGFLMGLSRWRTETLALGVHAAELMKRYWKARVGISFPRLRPAANVREDEYEHLVSDEELVQMMIALRLCFSDVELVLSTRESAKLRDNMINICATRISAGSRTNPGGYGGKSEAAEQFSVDDHRGPREIAEVIKRAGREAVWKDWDIALAGEKEWERRGS